MTLYGYARVSVREPEDKNLDLQVERLVRSGCAMGNIRAEEASGAKNDRGGLLELLDLVVEGDTLVVTHIDRLSRGLTHGLQVIEGLHRAGVEFRSLSEDFDTSTATGKLQLAMVLAFSEWWRNSIRDRSVAGQAKARAEGRFPGRRPSLTERQREYIRAERSKGVSQRELAKRLEVSLGWNLQPRHGGWPVGSLTQYRRGKRRGKVLPPVGAGPQGSIRWTRPSSSSSSSSWVTDRAKKSPPTSPRW